jgi:hypothetical protein
MPSDRYDAYVEHPRFGRSPRLTGLNPESDLMTGKPFLHWNATARIANTAVAADLSRQSRATVAVTHYYDVDRTCRDCGRPFIFFAEEQKHWYEELGLPLEADCVRCVPCRKAQQGLARTRARYQELFHLEQRTGEQTLEMAECCLSLIEAGEFHARQTQRVRELLNRLDKDGDAREHAEALRRRLAAVES